MSYPGLACPILSYPVPSYHVTTGPIFFLFKFYNNTNWFLKSSVKWFDTIVVTGQLNQFSHLVMTRKDVLLLF